MFNVDKNCVKFKYKIDVELINFNGRNINKI